jgi:hypothetical protein
MSTSAVPATAFESSIHEVSSGRQKLSANWVTPKLNLTQG